MSKWMLGLTIAALASVAAAQTTSGAPTDEARCTPDLCFDGGQSFDLGGFNDPAKTYEYLYVAIPRRVGLHLHESLWTVDLVNLANNTCTCYRAGNHNPQTGRDELFDLPAIFKAADFWGDGRVQPGNPYSILGRLNWNNPAIVPVTSYPGFETNGRGAVLWKGPIMCVNQKIVEKFSNAAKGWNFTAELKNTTPGFPTYLMADKLSGDGTRVAYLRKQAANTGPQLMASGSGPTGGWIDDHILEAMIFDGTEQPGLQSAVVEFKLTGNF